MISKSTIAPSLKDGCSKNLDVLGEMSHFNQWIFETISPFIGSSILEVGCGNARFSAMMIKRPDVEYYLGIDHHASYCQSIQELAASHPGKSISFQCVDLEKQRLGPIVTRPFHTIVCLNVLEHLQDDRAVLEDFASVLVPGGNLILQLPAFSWLYGSIDVAVGHYRRYSRGKITDLVRHAGFEIDRCFYFNLVGVAAWLWHGKIRRLKLHPGREMRLGDRLVPLFKAFESRVPIPIGLSLFVVAKKKT